MAVKVEKDNPQGAYGPKANTPKQKGAYAPKKVDNTSNPYARTSVPARGKTAKPKSSRSRKGGGTFPKSLEDILGGASDSISKFRDSLDSRGDGSGMDQQEMPPSFESFFAKALEMAGGGGGLGPGTDYTALRDRLTQNAGESDARLAAMYQQLQGSYDADAPGIAQSYDAALGSTAQASDQAAASTTAGYDDARSKQMAMLQELGIGDAAAVINQQSGNAANDEASALANIQQNKSAVQNQLSTNKSNAGTFNTQVTQAAGMEGNLQRATVQKALQDKLAELNIQEQQENQDRAGQEASLKSNSLSQALSMAGQMSDDWYQQKGYTQNLEDRDYQKQMDMQKLLQQQSTASQFDPQSILDQVAGMGASGGDVDYKGQAAMIEALRKLLSGG